MIVTMSEAFLPFREEPPQDSTDNTNQNTCYFHTPSQSPLTGSEVGDMRPLGFSQASEVLIYLRQRTVAFGKAYVLNETDHFCKWGCFPPRRQNKRRGRIPSAIRASAIW